MDVAPNYYVSQFCGRIMYVLLTLERVYVSYICTHINSLQLAHYILKDVS
jgi:hypothetical protein